MPAFESCLCDRFPRDGGSPRAVQWRKSAPYQMGSKRSDTPVADAVAFGVKPAGGSPTPRHEETTVVHSDKYSGCKDGSAVTLYAIQGGHHAWPGTRISGNDVSATDLIWTFFDQRIRSRSLHRPGDELVFIRVLCSRALFPYPVRVP